MVITFCMLVSDVYGSLVRNILHVLHLVPRIVWVGHRFWKICALLNCNIQQPTGPRCAEYDFYCSIFREDLILVLMLMRQKYYYSIHKWHALFFLKDITTLILLRELIVLGLFSAKVVLELFIQVFVFTMEYW